MPKHGEVRIAVRFEDFAGKMDVPLPHPGPRRHGHDGNPAVALRSRRSGCEWSEDFHCAHCRRHVARPGCCRALCRRLEAAFRACRTKGPARGTAPVSPAQANRRRGGARGARAIPDASPTHAASATAAATIRRPRGGWPVPPDRRTDFQIGPPPCGLAPKATGCFTTRPRNLTPDDATGLGRFTERQVFNALRYGLRPEDTPDVDITSTTPGKGNFPMRPHYLAPPMPWNAWRHMPTPTCAPLRRI